MSRSRVAAATVLTVLALMGTAEAQPWFIPPGAFGAVTWREPVDSFAALPACTVGGGEEDRVRVVRPPDAQAGIYYCPVGGPSWVSVGGGGGGGGISGVGACPANQAAVTLNDGAGPTCSEFSALGQSIGVAEIDDGGAAATFALFSGAGGDPSFRAIVEADVSDLVHTAPVVLDLDDDDINESDGLVEVAVINDDNFIFTEPAPNKLLISVDEAWPVADLANALKADAVGTVELDDDANTPAAGDFVVVETGDLSFDYVTPSAGTDITADLEEETHAAEHQHGGGDEVATATPGANAIPKAGAGGVLADGFVDGAAESDEVDHDLTVNFVADEHVAHSGVTVTAAAGLSGGGDLASSFSILTASQEPAFLADGGVTSLTCGAGNLGKMQVMDDGDLEWCDGATTSVLRSVDGSIATHAADASAHHTKTVDASELTTGTIPAPRVGADHVDAITEIAAALRSGLDTELITGTLDTTSAVVTINADDDLIEEAGGLTWNVTQATCTGDGNGGALTVNGSSQIICSADDGGAGGSGDAIEVEDGDDAGTFTAIDTTARLEDQGDINFTFADGGAGGPDTITATVRADSVALGTDTTGNYAASDAEGGDATGLTCTDCVDLAKLDDDAGTPVAGDFLTVRTGATDVTYTTPNAGTDITADLEEEAHAAEHAENAADELLIENLGTACAADGVAAGDGAGGLDCRVLLDPAASITWGGGSTFTHTFDAGATDPVWTFTSGVANLSTGALQVGGAAVATASDNLGFFSATTSAQLAGVLSDETGTGLAVFSDAPTFTTSITSPALISGAADPADAGAIRLGNAESIAWESSPAGADVTLTVDSAEVLQVTAGVTSTGTVTAAATVTTPSAQTCTDSGDGSPGVLSATVAGASYLPITNSDADGCTFSLLETGAVDGQQLVVVIASNAGGTVDLTDTAGVTEMIADFSLAIDDSITFLYRSDRWVETGRANN